MIRLILLVYDRGFIFWTTPATNPSGGTTDFIVDEWEV